MSIRLIQKYYAEIHRIIRYCENCKISKQSMIDLLMMTCTVSVETMKILRGMPK